MSVTLRLQPESRAATDSVLSLRVIRERSFCEMFAFRETNTFSEGDFNCSLNQNKSIFYSMSFCVSSVSLSMLEPAEEEHRRRSVKHGMFLFISSSPGQSPRKQSTVSSHSPLHSEPP